MLKRQISDEEKKKILEIHGKKCYATGHDIIDDDIQFDHIKAFSSKGPSDISNIAPMCQAHNLKKGRLLLHDFRIKLEVEDFFSQGQKLTLKDELKYFKNKNSISEYGKTCYFQINDKELQTEVDDKKTVHELFTCPVTKWKYFYAVMPVTAINSDDDEDGKIGLQPRYLIADKVFKLYRHLQARPVLQPSLARLHKNKILVFDGQHKIAALLWSGRRDVDLKIYIDPDPRILNNTNIDAHDTFAQTRFYSSIMVSKLGSQFGKQFEDYKNKEDDVKKTEQGFVEFLKIEEELTQGAVNKRFTSFLYNMVIDSEENKMSKFISIGNRGSSENPLTLDMVSKSIFAHFLYRKPLNEDMASDHYKRDSEINNIIGLCNILHDEALFNWDNEKDFKDTNQNKLRRMFSSKSIMAWTEILRDAVAARLEIFDAGEKEMLFYRELTLEEFDKIKIIFRRLVEWSLWSSPPSSEIDKVLSNSKNIVKEFMKDKELTVSYLLGASN